LDLNDVLYYSKNYNVLQINYFGGGTRCFSISSREKCLTFPVAELELTTWEVLFGLRFAGGLAKEFGCVRFAPRTESPRLGSFAVDDPRRTFEVESLEPRKGTGSNAELGFGIEFEFPEESGLGLLFTEGALACGAFWSGDLNSA
jgi:hypothetical protein